MSYIEREQSVYGGHPLELYRFALGGRLWLFTSADHEIANGREKYQPVFIRRGGFTKGGDARKSQMDIEIAASNELALLFRSGWLDSALVVTIFRHHYEDGEFSVLWKGRIVGCTWSGSVARLGSESVFTLFKRAGLRRVYQIGCPHLLYGPACRVHPDAWRFSAIASSVSGPGLRVGGAEGFAPGWFTGGMLQHGGERRMIVGHAGTDIRLIDGIEALAPGAAVELWPGCDRSVDTCRTKFGNIANYGGLPFLPAKNPFSGDALV